MTSDQVEMTEEKLRGMIQGCLEYAMETYASVFTHVIMRELRYAMSSENGIREKATIVLEDIPQQDDLFWYFAKSHDLESESVKNILTFDEKKGMLELEEVKHNWDEEHNTAEIKLEIKEENV
jgi:hypothetical protein